MIAGDSPACRVVDPRSGNAETMRYLNSGGDQIYVTQHHAKGSPRAGVLLCGSIGAERERGYRTLVDLARTLAAAGFEVFRFDYRGIGESTGRFEELCLSDWQGDILECVALVRALVPDRPLALWGVRAGALLAAALFRDGVGDGGMFCAPADGRQLLQDMLRRYLVADMLANPDGAPRPVREEMIAAMENGATVHIDGYPWRSCLWEDAAAHCFAYPAANEVRPWSVLDFRGQSGAAHAAARHRGHDGLEPFWLSSPVLVPRSTRLFARTLAWLQLLAPAGRKA